MSTDQRWFHPRGSLAHGGWESVVDESVPGWAHTGIRVAQLHPPDVLDLPERGVERIVVPLSGSFSVTHTDGRSTKTTHLQGRASVFAGPTDVLYLSAGTSAELTGEGRVAIAASPTEVIKPTRHISAGEIPVELRGAGLSSRQVHNFGTPQVLDAARLIVCEVITPAGNWSSYPPHKHDEHVPGHESRLEEIYYFEAAPVGGSDAAEEAAFAMFSTYSSPAGEIGISAMVRSGDIALVPYGYHGPAVAAPGYDLYYLNVMAGPDPERAWLISDDPAHAWVRDSWNGLQVDARLPYTTRKEGQH
ncbi:5-deoxyglucuronate isomerase [Microbacterium sp. cf046]|uniref:5-deoxy-glucuronate isomerase n=1 Tax=Microbacterium sp. cf046 TaxID=1761803 RepID=UPI0008E845CF|nr:5-deoxy-glucuronate isomerase [Microbacterium sp. cf046]SFR92234.1 5-deoxyglucuronate isomerase [Microbacterium sp. cf046]